MRLAQIQLWRTHKSTLTRSARSPYAGVSGSISPSSYQKKVDLKKRLVTLTDMTKPHLWYPQARSMRRKVILHIGPTNSGKTHQALLSLVQAESAIYCAPLRLLASEVWEKMNTVYDVHCDLITGQQQIKLPGARHIACTIEMASLTRQVSVAMIDEYQLISDSQRGWAWTRALLGLPARELHLTGDTSRVELVRYLCGLTGDELEVREYQRLSPLKVEKRGVVNWENIEEGDAIITFSRNDVYDLKKKIEKSKNLKCCVVYGSLPPESRSEQARLFNDTSSAYKVLVGTDCIGMGLNLNIRRIIFEKCRKFDGQETRQLTPSEIRQIAGRAGRFQSAFPKGYVTSYSTEDLTLIKSAMAHKDRNDPENHKAMVFPNFEQISMFSEIIGPKIPFSDILELFASKAKLELKFEMADYGIMYEQALSIDHLALELKDRYTFCMAPTDPKSFRVMKHFTTFAEIFSAEYKVPFYILPPIRTKLPKFSKLLNLETDYKITELYIWLANRFEEEFNELPKAEKHLEWIVNNISEILNHSEEETRIFLEKRYKTVKKFFPNDEKKKGTRRKGWKNNLDEETRMFLEERYQTVKQVLPVKDGKKKKNLDEETRMFLEKRYQMVKQVLPVKYGKKKVTKKGGKKDRVRDNIHSYLKNLF